MIKNRKNVKGTAGPVARLLQKREFCLVLLLLILIPAVGCVNRSFLDADNLRDMLVQCAPALIVACGMTFVILLGEIDISVGSMMGLLAALMGIMTSTQHMGLPVGVGILLTLFLGTLLGFINGVLIAYGRVPSIIATLGMLTALEGTTQIIMRGEWIEDLPHGLRVLGTGSVYGIPICILVAALVAVAAMLFARETPLGRRIYAVGSNPQAAKVAGLPVTKIKLFVFTLTGFLTAVATLVSVPQLSVIESGIGRGFEMLVITCVVVGGASVSGGKGSIIGSLLGVLLLVPVRTELIFLNLKQTATYWERAIQGAFILVAVLADHIAGQGSRKDVH